jgi:glycerol kinase
MTASKLLLQLQADILNVPVGKETPVSLDSLTCDACAECPANRETTSLGAAIAAGYAQSHNAHTPITCRA